MKNYQLFAILWVITTSTLSICSSIGIQWGLFNNIAIQGFTFLGATIICVFFNK